ncbi:antiviral reverse transcriptase Drt3a [Psychroflexus aestuariivivens]|uniref:antiviral reverse transcriptase Drt3a n=1 Tax=Psychroflexus aestuariivivens TaxID=1795040 RepID=UPI000FDAFE36|nr:antiviral reverse transcriptase Drt3a [Psychroflexus aestuariivivens]
MLDQSFSANNFRTIFDIANRNGVFVEDKLSLTTIRAYTDKIKNYGKLAKQNKKSGNFILSKFFNEVKEEVREQRNIEIDNVLESISVNVSKKDFCVSLKQISIPGGKDLYTIDNKPELFFAIKQVQYNVSRLYNVKQSNRNSVVEQLICLLQNEFPKTIIRTDISSFYESIDHTVILKKINQDNLLSPKSRKIIHQILRSYKDLSGSDKGLPRGIGVSAYLAELYMRKIDRIIKQQDDIIYYARYVDDIVVIFTPNINGPKINYLDQVKYAIEDNSQVLINSSKTLMREINDEEEYNFEFLGYNFSVKKGVIKTKLTEKKYEKLKWRLNTAFENYNNLSVVDEKTARKLLVWRIRFLTGNTKLANNKSNILIGIYYSNSFLSEKKQIGDLDGLLKKNIHTKLTSVSLKRRLCKYSFKDGFEGKRFSEFNGKQLKEIMKIWK